jgi:hypothetical protein
VLGQVILVASKAVSGLLQWVWADVEYQLGNCHGLSAWQLPWIISLATAVDYQLGNCHGLSAWQLLCHKGQIPTALMGCAPPPPKKWEIFSFQLLVGFYNPFCQSGIPIL